MRTPKSTERFDYGIITHRDDHRELIVNGTIFRTDDLKVCCKWIEKKLISTKRCKYCSSKLKILGSYFDPFSGDWEPFTNHDPHQRIWPHEAMLWTCENCRYWQWYSGGTVEVKGSLMTNELTAALSKLRTFEPSWPHGCYEELSQHLRRNQKLWHHISPGALERFVAAVYRSNFSDCEVFHVGKSNDGGIDVVFVDSGQQQWLIQVKRRKHKEVGEGVGTLRNLLGAMVLNNTLRGIVVSTSDHFTYQALKAVGRAREVGMQIQLVDLGKLNRMLGAALPNDLYLPFLEEMFPHLANQFIPRIFRQALEDRQLQLFTCSHKSNR